jgi:hypothetical protein
MGPACKYSRSSYVNECITLLHMKVKLILQVHSHNRSLEALKTCIIDPFYSDKTETFIIKHFVVRTNPNRSFTPTIHDAFKWTNYVA